MSKFHEDWEKMCLLDCSHKTAPLPGGHTKHVTSRVKKTPPPHWRPCFFTDPNHYRTQLAVSFAYANEPVTGRKNAPPLGSHVFQAKVTIFELIQDIIGTNHLSKFHEDRKINMASRVLTKKNAPPPGGHVFQSTDIIFKLFQDIIGMNLLTKFHEDRTINVASRVLTRFCYSHKRKNAPPLGNHVFQANVTIFEVIQDIIETNLLTKFTADWTINVASRE
ncbi:hypothetical protein DPMN_045328 [Dreissena polymorpha]|uniref:Uncharacterized protein n=1 Tax=Dreissena polymorpha TaxID=45954 RepID=A0A9D4D467_DREPO|nr:hypothetical protein DPMN_045328 [Dreissena polymorpha]